MKKLYQLVMIVIAIPSIALSQNLPDLTALSETIKPQVSSIRSLNFIQPFTIRYQSNVEMTAFINRAFNQSVPQTIRQNYDLVIRAIGLHHAGVPFDFEALKRATQGQIGAYYDPETRSVNFPMRSSSSETLKSIIVHELVHVLQDQHFGLDRLLSDATNSDEIISRQALAEGDATLAETLYLFLELGGAVPADPQLQIAINLIANTTADEIKQDLKNAEADPQAVQEIENTPNFLFEQLSFPYFRGVAFVYHLRRRGGWPTVNRAYTHPPLSTEHILHPDKYFAGESLEVIALPNLANEPFAGDWELLDQDTLGELGLRIIFNTFDVNTPSYSESAGWHGDQYVVLKHRDGAPALVLFTTWDTEQDAIEFKTAYEDVLAIKRRGSTDFRIEQQGTDVLIAESSRDLDLLFAYLKKVRFTPTVTLGVFDFDGDLMIGFTDFLLFAAHFGKSSSDPDFDPRFDIDADGMVGFSDFLAFASAFGKQITRNSKPAVAIDPHIIHRTLGFVR